MWSKGRAWRPGETALARRASSSASPWRRKALWLLFRSCLTMSRCAVLPSALLHIPILILWHSGDLVLNASYWSQRKRFGFVTVITV